MYLRVADLADTATAAASLSLWSRKASIPVAGTRCRPASSASHGASATPAAARGRCACALYQLCQYTVLAGQAKSFASDFV
jgi:hypothetical protein